MHEYQPPVQSNKDTLLSAYSTDWKIDLPFWRVNIMKEFRHNSQSVQQLADDMDEVD